MTEAPSRKEIDNYIGAVAGQYGIDPATAIAVSNAEMPDPNNWVGDNGSSAGPFQLHYGGISGGGNAVAGEGDNFTQRTGLSAFDKTTWRQQVDYALSRAVSTGWTPWHAAAKIGISARQGIGVPPSSQSGNSTESPLDTIINTQGGTQFDTPTGMDPKLTYVFPIPGYQGDPRATYHTAGASDLFAPRNTPVLSIVSGTVTSSGFYEGTGGYYALIRGDDGLDYYYAHFNEPASVSAGQRVSAGEQIGKVGDSGNAAGAGTHLHIGIGYGISNGVGAEGGAGLGGIDAQGILATILGQGGETAGVNPDGTPAETVTPVEGIGNVISQVPDQIGNAVAGLQGILTGFIFKGFDIGKLVKDAITFLMDSFVKAMIGPTNGIPVVKWAIDQLGTTFFNSIEWIIKRVVDARNQTFDWFRAQSSKTIVIFFGVVFITAGLIGMSLGAIKAAVGSDEAKVAVKVAAAAS